MATSLLPCIKNCSPWRLRSHGDTATEEDIDQATASKPPATTRVINKPSGWKCMPYIIGNETFEKVAATGLTANLTVYLVSKFHMEEVAAANLAQIFFGTTNFAPLLGAFVSDAYLGRFRTLAFASIASFLGMVALTLTSTVPLLRPAACTGAAHRAGGSCPAPTTPQLAVLISSLLLLVVGAGGIRPCSLPFGVDQFDASTEQGKKGLDSFFNWYYCTTTGALLVGLTVVVYIQDSVSWPIGFGIPAALMLLSIAFFFLGGRLYFHVPPEGSVFSGIAHVLVAAYRKRSLELPFPGDLAKQESALYNIGDDTVVPANSTTKLPLSSQFEFLNKAAIIADDSSEVGDGGYPVNPWRLAGVQQVEEVKCLLRIIPIWVSGVVCFVAVSQQWTFVVLQAMTMDRRFGRGRGIELPPGTISSISLLSLTLFMPLYDKAVVPAARRITGRRGGITLLQRQGVGIVISVLSMVVAGLVEARRRRSAPAPMSAMWLAPQLVLMGISEAFNAVGQIEFYNRQFPEKMKTLAGSLFFCSLAGASYLSSALAAVVKRWTRHGEGKSWLESDINAGRLDLFYYAIAVIGAANLVFFLVCARFYRYKAEQTLLH